MLVKRRCSAGWRKSLYGARLTVAIFAVGQHWAKGRRAKVIVGWQRKRWSRSKMEEAFLCMHPARHSSLVNKSSAKKQPARLAACTPASGLAGVAGPHRRITV